MAQEYPLIQSAQSTFVMAYDRLPAGDVLIPRVFSDPTPNTEGLRLSAQAALRAALQHSETVNKGYNISDIELMRHIKRLNGYSTPTLRVLEYAVDTLSAIGTDPRLNVQPHPYTRVMHPSDLAYPKPTMNGTGISFQGATNLSRLVGSPSDLGRALHDAVSTLHKGGDPEVVRHEALDDALLEVLLRVGEITSIVDKDKNPVGWDMLEGDVMRPLRQNAKRYFNRKSG